jgi:spermidine/putrescine-binding protein
MLVEPGTGAGSVVLKDGGASGTTVMTINTVANGEPFSVVIPAEGVLFQTDAYAVLTGAKVTVFYG